MTSGPASWYHKVQGVGTVSSKCLHGSHSYNRTTWNWPQTTEADTVKHQLHVPTVQLPLSWIPKIPMAVPIPSNTTHGHPIPWHKENQSRSSNLNYFQLTYLASAKMVAKAYDPMNTSLRPFWGLGRCLCNWGALRLKLHHLHGRMPLASRVLDSSGQSHTRDSWKGGRSPSSFASGSCWSASFSRYEFLLWPVGSRSHGLSPLWVHRLRRAAVWIRQQPSLVFCLSVSV